MHKQPLPIHYCQRVGVQEAEVNMWRSSSGRRNACGSCHSSASHLPPFSILLFLTLLLAQTPGHNLSVAFCNSTTLWLVQYLHISQRRGRSCVADTWSVVNVFGLLPERSGGVRLSGGSPGCVLMCAIVCLSTPRRRWNPTHTSAIWSVMWPWSFFKRAV